MYIYRHKRIRMTNTQSKYKYEQLSFDEVMANISKKCHGCSSSDQRKIFTDMWTKYKQAGFVNDTQLQQITSTSIWH